MIRALAKERVKCRSGKVLTLMCQFEKCQSRGGEPSILSVAALTFETNYCTLKTMPFPHNQDLRKGRSAVGRYPSRIVMSLGHRNGVALWEILFPHQERV